MAEFECGLVYVLHWCFFFFFVFFFFCFFFGFFLMIFTNDIHSKFINMGLPTDPLVEDRVLVKHWLEWPKNFFFFLCFNRTPQRRLFLHLSTSKL